MLIRNKSTFNVGLVLAITFLGVLVVIFSPVFGEGKNGLVYSDDLFNKLSKGSSYFIPKLNGEVQKFNGKTYTETIKLEKAENAEKIVKMLIAAGAQVGAKDTELKITADLGKLLGVVLKDSDAMYHNNGAEVSGRYGLGEKDVMKLWWEMLNKVNKELQKEKKIDESNVVLEVMRKGVEPSYNYYKVEAQNVTDKALIMTALLVFYVVYTMWWGYAIFYLFDGIGLSMKKAKVKKEA